MGDARWNVQTACAIVQCFCERISWPDERRGVCAVGFGLRGPSRRPSLTIQRSPHEARDANRSGIPASFSGFDVAEEIDEIIPAGRRWDKGWDKLRRARGKAPDSAWPGWAGAMLQAQGLGRTGTLGCFVRHNKTRKHYALTCEHVVSTPSAGRAAIGVPVSSYVLNYETPPMLLGKVAQLGSLVAPKNSVDSALIEVANARMCQNVLPRIGRLSTSPVPFGAIELGETPVCKYGAVSAYSTGLITGVKSVQLEKKGYPPIRLNRVLQVTPRFDGPRAQHNFTSFCDEGDSGAIVVLHHEGRAIDAPIIGQLVGYGTILERGYVVGMEKILNCFDVSLC